MFCWRGARRLCQQRNQIISQHPSSLPPPPQVIADFANGEISQAASLFDTEITLDHYLDKSFYKVRRGDALQQLFAMFAFELLCNSCFATTVC